MGKIEKTNVDKTLQGSNRWAKLFFCFDFFLFLFFFFYSLNWLSVEQERAGIVGGGEKRMNEQPRRQFQDTTEHIYSCKHVI